MASIGSAACAATCPQITSSAATKPAATPRAGRAEGPRGVTAGMQERSSPGTSGVHFLFHLLDADVADVLALDEVDDALADVARVIADALQGARGPHRVQGAGDVARVFHHVGD